MTGSKEGGGLDLKLPKPLRKKKKFKEKMEENSPQKNMNNLELKGPDVNTKKIVLMSSLKQTKKKCKISSHT